MVRLASRTCTIPGLNDFLTEQPFLAIKPSRGDTILIEGDFRFTAESSGIPRVTDTYTLLISLPPSFPRDVPTVTEIGGRIPRYADYHINKNGTLCLGSPMRLMLALQAEPTLSGFSRRCIVPYLYAMTNALKNGRRFIFGELNHGTPGEIEDYKALLGLKSHTQVPHAMRCILAKKRLANKLPCPCECGKRLGRCRYNATIKNFRTLLPKTWLRSRFRRLLTELSTFPAPP